MATISSTTTTGKAALRRKQPEKAEGPDSTSGDILWRKKVLDDASITPKVTDWIIDADGVKWEIKSISLDPTGQMYKFGVKDV